MDGLPIDSVEIRIVEVFVYCLPNEFEGFFTFLLPGISGANYSDRGRSRLLCEGAAVSDGIHSRSRGRAFLVRREFPWDTDTRGRGGRARPGRLRSRCDARGGEFRDCRLLRSKAAVGPKTVDNGAPPTPSCGSRDSKDVRTEEAGAWIPAAVAPNFALQRTGVRGAPPAAERGRSAHRMMRATGNARVCCISLKPQSVRVPGTTRLGRGAQ